MRDTADLSLAEHGAYTMLLDHYYSTEQPLPADIIALCRLCRAMSPEEQAAVKVVADRFFPVMPDGMRHNPRADEEIGSAQGVMEKQRESGLAAARRRWGPDGSTGGSTHPGPDGSGGGLTGGSAIQPPTSNHHTPTAKPQPPAAKPQPPRKTKAAAAQPWVLPDWVPADSWQAFLEVRAKLRTPNTDSALSLLLRKLDKLRAEGFDAAEVLDQSTMRGWSGVFPVKAEQRKARLSVVGEATVASLANFVKKGAGNA